MRTRIYKLYATGSADANAAAQIIVQRNALITSVLWVPRVTARSGTASIEWELSLASTAQLTTNDTIGPISGCAQSFLELTSGVGTTVPLLHSGLAVPVMQGDRLYLHVDVTATLTAFVNVYVSAAE